MLIQKDELLNQRKFMLNNRDKRLIDLRNKLESFYKEKYTYKGYGDKNDRLDMLLI